MKEIYILQILCGIVGYIIGSLREKWNYYNKTGKHLQDIDNAKKECIIHATDLHGECFKCGKQTLNNQPTTL